MGAYEACLACGSQNHRIGYGTDAATSKTLALRACKSCGTWSRTLLSIVESAQILADREVQIIDQPKAA